MCERVGLRGCDLGEALICEFSHRDKGECGFDMSGLRIRDLCTMDLRVMDMSEFDVILGLDWLTTYQVVIDYESRRVIAYAPDGTCFTFKGDKHDALP